MKRRRCSNNKSPIQDIVEKADFASPSFPKTKCSKQFKNKFLIWSYIENVILNLIEILKTSIYNTEEHPKHPISFSDFSFFENPYFQKLNIRRHQRFVQKVTAYTFVNKWPIPFYYLFELGNSSGKTL